MRAVLRGATPVNPKRLSLTNTMNCLKLVVVSALTVSAALAQVFTPQGRLTLTSGTPVMTSSVTAATTIYYVPDVGNLVPVGSGNIWGYNSVGSGVSVALSSTYQTAGNIYDVFAFLHSGSTPTLGIGPAWASVASRGSGSGSTAIGQSSANGLWVAANPITLYNGNTSYYVDNGSGNWATYLGSFYATANGQTEMVFLPTAASGGTQNILGLYNAYNRVRTIAASSDSTSSWAYSVATWREADNSASNSIYFLDGLQQSAVHSEYTCIMEPNTGGQGDIGIDLDSTTATPSTPVAATYSTAEQSYTAHGYFLPQLGVHYVQAMEVANSAGVTFIGLGNEVTGLMLEIDM